MSTAPQASREIGGNMQQMLTVRQFSEASGLSEWMVRKLCRNGLIAARKFGNVWRISPKELEA